MLWRLRLRPSAPLHLRLDLATQLPLVLTAISVATILVVTGVLISQIRTSQIEQVQRNFQTLADIHAERVGNSLDQQIEGLSRWATRDRPARRAGRANASYPELEAERRALLAEREQTWETSPESSDFVLRVPEQPDGRSS